MKGSTDVGKGADGGTLGTPQRQGWWKKPGETKEVSVT